MPPKTRASDSSPLIRLNKCIADSGLASRRKADELIEEGLVQINGKTTYELGVKVDPKLDRITVRGKPLRTPGKRFYYVLNKPKGVVTTMSDPEGRPCVGDFFRRMKTRLFPVGRLDWDSEGLLLLTNDGDFSNEVMHPRKGIAKTYLVKVDGQPTAAQLQKLRDGVTIIGGKVKALRVERQNKGSSKYDWIKISISEGKNRQVRRMFEKIGYDVTKLKRIGIGQLKLGTLKKGEYRQLTALELEKIFKSSKTSDGTSNSRSTSKKSPRRKERR